MARLSFLKTDRSHNGLQVGQQRYRVLMIENFFDILSLKNWRILHYLKIGYKSILFMKRITKSTKRERVLQFYSRPQTYKYKTKNKRR